jgi:predicted RNA-binding protein with PIN domain
VALPEDIELVIVDAIGAYIREIPATEVPGRLRRFRGFRPKGLVPHRAELVAVLDDDVERKRIVQWLDDGARPLTATQRDILRIAAAHAEGWEEELAARSTGGGPRTPASPDYKAEAASERAKARAAREEAKVARAEGRAAAQRERQRAAALQRELVAAKQEADALRAALDEARAEVARAGEDRDRVLRRADRELASVRDERDRTRAELKAARKEVAELKARLADLERPAAKAPAPHTRRADEPPEQRTPLPVPKGLLEEDPQTLDRWLDEAHVSLLIDGYNVSKSESGFGDLSLASQRTRLVDEVERLSRRRGVPATIVFDGAQMPPGTARLSRRHVGVEYSKPPESADDHLVAVLQAMPNWPVIVVSNDRGLRERLESLGATCARSEQLLGLMR